MIKVVIALIVVASGFVAFRYYQVQSAQEKIVRLPASPAKTAPKVDLQSFLDKGNLRGEKLVCNAGNCELTLSLKKKGTCFEGDWDAINMDLKFSAARTFLVSVEPLGTDVKSFRPLAWRLSLKSLLEDGLQQKITFPQPTGSLPLGVFICKDAAGTGRCADKPQLDQGTHEMHLAEALKKDPKAQSIDRVYFFQWILLEKERVLVNKAGESFWTPEIYDGRANYLVAVTPQKTLDAKGLSPEFQIKQDMLFALQRHNTMKSLPLETTPGTLALVLPAQDKSVRCESAAKKD